jgi:molybdopterin molybdotransferase
VIDVDKAARIVLRHKIGLGSSRIDYIISLGKVLDESVIADRDIPAFNRATMDGVAISYKDFAADKSTFKITGIQAAGALPIKIKNAGECIQIMTGAALDKTLDTVVRIEDVVIKGGLATIAVGNISKGQFVHVKGSDKKQSSLLVDSGQVITPDLLATMASVGKTSIRVVSPPKIIIITSGDELVNPDKTVNEYEVRRSNDLAIYGLLHNYGVGAEMIHVKDDEKLIMQNIKKALKTFDAVITVGGVSKGKYDYVQTALTKLGATKHFHGVEQKPGKPLWFGSLNDKPIFGLPGNPVSVYISMVRYVIPWLEVSLGVKSRPNLEAMLDQDVTINPELTHFVLVKTYIDASACLRANPVANNNSGDFTSLSSADAFIELPAGRSVHKQDSLYRLWPYKNETM